MRKLPLAMIATVLVAAQADEKVDNPEYKGWVGQAAGAWVKFNTEVETGGVKKEFVTTTKLNEISSERALIDQAEEIDVNGMKVVNHGIRSLAAKIRKGTDSDGLKVEPKSKGVQELEIKGTKLKCPWVEEKVTGKDDLMTVRTWRHDTIVGGIAKIVFKIEKPEKKTITRTATDWKAAE